MHSPQFLEAKSTYMPTNPIAMEDLDAGEVISGDWRQR
jgi:hypothetical protein